MIQYAAVGGFPAAVADFLNTGEISEDTVRTLWSFVSTDLVGLGRDPQVMARLLERVGLSLGTLLSWNRLAGELGVSAPTAQDYVRHLTESFAIISLYAWDTSRETVALRKGKKLYALDPLFLRVPGLMGSSPRQPALPQMVEDLIGMGLYRTGEVPHLEGIYMPRTLFYWVSKKGREVDFLVWRSGAQTPVEVRYQQRVRPVDGQVMYQAFRRGLLASRLSFSLEGSIPIVPAGVFLWLLEDGLRSPVSD